MTPTYKGMHDIAAYQRAERARRKLERKAQATGEWGPWSMTDLPNGAGTVAWAKDFRFAAKNDRMAVMIRSFDHPIFGRVRHLMMSTMSGIEPTWKEKQRVKDEIIGPEYTAVEVMPPQNEIVDQADAYHIWAFKADIGLTIKH